MNCQSQKSLELSDKYYMINKSGFVEWTITNDSIFNKKLSSNFSSKRNKKVSYAIAEKINLEDRVVLLSKSDKNEESYTSVITLGSLDDKEHIIQVINSIDTTANIETLIKLNKKDKSTLVGFNLYTKDQIDSFKQLKPIENMSLNEFKIYLKKYYKKMKYAVPAFSKSRFKGVYGMSSSFNFQMVSQTLLEEGFNPVQNSKTTDALFKKYLENSEIKELIENLKKRE